MVRPELIELATFDTAGWAHDVILHPDRAFVADRQGGFLIFQRARGWVSPAIHRPVGDVISLAPYGENFLLASRFEGLVLVSAAGDVMARYSNGDIANTVATRDNMAFVAYGLHGLVVVRIEPTSLGLVSVLPFPGWAHDIKLYGNYALIADWHYGLRVADLSRPDSPMEVGSLPTSATAIAVGIGDPGHRLVAVAEGHAGVSIVTIDESGQPTLLGHHSLGLNPADSPHPEAGGWAHGAAWAGRYLFVANWKRGLAILDATDLHNPRLVLERNTGGTALAVAAETQPDGSVLVLLADGEAGLRAFSFRR